MLERLVKTHITNERQMRRTHRAMLFVQVRTCC